LAAVGRHSGKSGGAQSIGRAPRWPARAVRWLSQPGSGEALTSWGTVLIVFGGLLCTLTAWGYFMIVVGTIVGALGLDASA
jgi:hypothetical protein